jgi:uncharacterized protein (DUF488 family)
MKVFATVGYRGRSPERVVELVWSELEEAGVGRLSEGGVPTTLCFLDCRRSGTSRAVDWSGEQKLRASLHELGCTLCIAKDASGRRILGNASQARPWRSSNPEAATLLLDSLAGLLTEGVVLVLFCLEQDHEECHRTDLIAEFARRVPGLRVVHVPSRRCLQ